MLFLVKVIGAICTIAIPTSICGTQAFLSKKHQTAQKKKIEAEFTQTQNSLNTAHTNYQTQIKRIKDEKNALATTKSTLTYKPVNIQTNIGKLTTAKSDYETKHTQTQTEITNAISAHNTSLNNKKTEIEQLWTGEKTRVENINSSLESAITTVRETNKTLNSSIQTLKDQIDQKINDIFNPPPSTP